MYSSAVEVEFNAKCWHNLVISVMVFTANHWLTVQENTQTNYNLQNETTQNTAKENYPGSVVASYDTRPGNKKGLFYNAPENKGGQISRKYKTHIFTAQILRTKTSKHQLEVHWWANWLLVIDQRHLPKNQIQS